MTKHLSTRAKSTSTLTLCAVVFSLSPFTTHAFSPFEIDSGFDAAVSQEEATDQESLSLEEETATPPFDWLKHFTNPTQIWGVKLGPPVSIEKNIDSRVKPASTSKLFTALLVLTQLDAHTRFQTKLRFHTALQDPSLATRLKIIGSGNPAPAFPFDEWAEQLKARGIKRVAGEITTGATHSGWATATYPQGWDLGADPYLCFGALPRALNLNYNCAYYDLKSATQGGFADPDVPDTVDLDFKTAKRNDVTVSLGGKALPSSLNGVPARPRLKLSGTLTSHFPKRYALPVMNPEKWFAAKLKRALIRAGIQLVARSEVAHVLSKGVAPAAALTEDSPPISELLVPFLKSSINLVGEALFLKVGESERGNQSLLAHAQASMQNYLRTRGFTETVLYDGSGLSRDNRVTARELYVLLEEIKASSHFETIWNALPIAGVDGTLRYRMRGTIAQNILRGKTGTLTGVSNLAGYVPVYNKKGTVTGYSPYVMLSSPKQIDPLVVVQPVPSVAKVTDVFAKHVARSISPAHQIQDQAGVALVNATLAKNSSPTAKSKRP